MPQATMCVPCAMEEDEQLRQAYLRPDPDAQYPRGW